MTDHTPPARDRLFALIASIPGSGTVDWCGEARALLDEITAASAAGPATPAPTDRALALLRDAESYLSALHGSVARHDNLGVNLGCAGCELRDRITAALPTLADTPPAVDRAAVLRDAADHLARQADELWAPGRTAHTVMHADAAELRRVADETAATQTPAEAQQTSPDHARQTAYDAVYAYIRQLGDEMPHSRIQRNAIIWRAVNAALAAQPAGETAATERCAHCTHPKRDHDGRADHRERHSPVVAGEPWCHACNSSCDYTAAQPADETAATETGPRTVAYRASSGYLFCLNCGTGGGLTKLTSEDLPDGGLCADCDTDVFTVAAAQPAGGECEHVWVGALDGDNKPAGYTHCGVCGARPAGGES